MHEIYELKDMLCEELEKYGSKGDLNTGELEIVDKLAHAVKNLGKIIEMAEEEEYSGQMMGGGSYQGGSYQRGGGGGGNRGGSYQRGGRGGRNNNPTGRNQYSRERGYSRAAEDMVDQLRDMMEEAPDQQTRKEIQRLITKMEQMM